MTGRMTRGELRMARDYLGLSTTELATLLGVRDDTVRRWESGRDPIPHGIGDELSEIEEGTADALDGLLGNLRYMGDPAVVVYRSDAEMHEACPESSHLPARWWRHVVARACYLAGSVVVGYPGEVDGVGVASVTLPQVATPLRRGV